MQLEYKRAVKNDADLLINIYNTAFYDDYVRYGECQSDKVQNIRFYTEKCGFHIGEKEMDGNVEVLNFYMER